MHAILKVKSYFLACLMIILGFFCKAQVFIEKGTADKVFFNDDRKDLYFGKAPVLSLSLSDFVLEEITSGIVEFGDWTDLTAKQCSAKVEISEYSDDMYHIGLDIIIDPEIDLRDLYIKFKFMPLNPLAWRKAVKDFHWIPNIKAKPSHIASDHVFRSPVVMMMAGNAGVALIPDLECIKINRPAPFYLDMRFNENGAPEIIYGISNYSVEPHQYYRKNGEPYNIKSGSVRLGFYLFVDQNTVRNELLRNVNGLLWNKYGHDYLLFHEPQTVPFGKYADYGYEMALNKIWINASYPNSGGITLATYFDKSSGKWGGRTYPDDLWFHSWFNNMRTAYGLYLWGKKMSKPAWTEKALKIKNLILNAPVDKGFFKTLYNSQASSWDASGQGGGKNVYHLPDNAWTAYWLLRFSEDCEKDEKINSFILDFALALLKCQQSDGSFPARVFTETLQADSILNRSASEALPIWFLAEMRIRGHIPVEYENSVDEAIKKGLDHIRSEILPDQKFEDFELYLSCSRKPLDFYDPVSQMYGQNTLSIQWCAEAFRTGFQLYKRLSDRENALFCLDLLCLYQQVWNPDYLSFYAFGGFGVMNTDAEWNDARQAQFAETLANFYDFTGNIEYLERAVAATKASFALMVIDENENLAPRNYKGLPKGLEIHGAMAENYGHCGTDCRSGQSGFHWGTGSALSTAVIMQQRYGDLFINTELKHAIGLNGLVINDMDFKRKSIRLSVDRLTSDEYLGKILQIKVKRKPDIKIKDNSVIYMDKASFKIIKQ